MKCPACGLDNLAGSDRCEGCLESLRDLDIPQPTEGLQAHIMLDPVKDLTVLNPVSVSSNDPVSRAIDLMRDRRAGCVLVIDENRLTGILSEVDLLFRMPAGGPVDGKVSELMTPNPETIEEDTTIAYALHMMSIGGYRHLPVIRQDQSIGIVSIKDLMRYLGRHLL